MLPKLGKPLPEVDDWLFSDGFFESSDGPSLLPLAPPPLSLKPPKGLLEAGAGVVLEASDFGANRPPVEAGWDAAFAGCWPNRPPPVEAGVELGLGAKSPPAGACCPCPPNKFEVGAGVVEVVEDVAAGVGPKLKAGFEVAWG